MLVCTSAFASHVGSRARPWGSPMMHGKRWARAPWRGDRGASCRLLAAACSGPEPARGQRPQASTRARTTPRPGDRSRGASCAFCTSPPCNCLARGGTGGSSKARAPFSRRHVLLAVPLRPPPSRTGTASGAPHELTGRQRRRHVQFTHGKHVVARGDLLIPIHGECVVRVQLRRAVERRRLGRHGPGVGPLDVARGLHHR